MGKARQLAEALRAGIQVSDRELDRYLPETLRRASGRFWTPLVVVQRIAGWLLDERIGTLVDIGAGCGKYAVATAMACDVRVIGIEHRLALVETARELARTFDVDDRVTFLHGDLAALPVAEAYYLYNPFAENAYGPHERLDEDVAHSPDKFDADIERTEDFLDAAPVDTCVVIYNGFGGHIPDGYAQIHVDRYMPNILRMFRKTRMRG
ncbi:MAG: class I SAM-dependent methyltransferase [Proteobacteria bacterium]|nr:class I SAM-dependent methyltransferase [Pseudomonadota bacterium]